MRISEADQIVTSHVDLRKWVSRVPGTMINIYSFPFVSNAGEDLLSIKSDINSESGKFFPVEDPGIKENQNFAYHIVAPRGRDTFQKAIFMMHGLNEKSWRKYLPWAITLAENTGNPVILFPFAFHMDRAPATWSQPRVMQSLSQFRKLSGKSISETSFMNAALSERLDNHPMRFYLSGFQTGIDLFRLMGIIKEGAHPLFCEGARIDFFGYSIGAFLAQIMLIANKDDTFSDSKCFLFAGGSVFEDMDGKSKLIMDSSAFSRLLSYFINDLETEMGKSNRYSSILTKTELGLAFRSMIGRNINSAIRDSVFHHYGNRISAVALLKDRVIPASHIQETVKGKNGHIKSNFETIDFPYEYSHENPFPVGKVQDNEELDRAFQKVFDKASHFLN